MKLTTETITPAVAAEWLPKFTKHNRKLRRAVVEGYARDMAEGNWHLTGDPIRWNGAKGIDGQHRLAACITAGVPFRTAVARGVTSDAHIAIDTGAARTMGDELRYRGEKDVNVLASVLGMVWRYDNDIRAWAKAPRHGMIALLENNPEIRESLLHTSNKAFLPRTVLATVHFLATRVHTKVEADAWLESVLSDAGHVEGDAALALRRFGLNVKTDKNRHPRQEEWVAVTIKSFNLWLNGGYVSNLRWRKGGSAPEAFPTIQA